MSSSTIGTCPAELGLLVVELVHQQSLPELVPAEDRPAGALDRGGGRGEVGLEGVERTEVLVERRGELAVGLVTALGGEVLPERRVVHVPAEVEGERLLQPDDRVEVPAGARLRELVEHAVQRGDVGVVVLGMVQLHDLRRDVRGQGAVVVGQVRQRVLGHEGHSVRCRGPSASTLALVARYSQFKLLCDKVMRSARCGHPV
jgi:hypothetical protein